MRMQSQAQLSWVGAVVLILIIGVATTLLVGSWSFTSEPAVTFSYCDWMDPEITTADVGTLQLRVKNAGEDDYHVAIQISTKSPDVIISYIDEISSQANNEFQLTHPIGILRRHEESKLYTFDVWATLELGTLSKEVELVARVLANGDVTEEKTLALRIKAEG